MRSKLETVNRCIVASLLGCGVGLLILAGCSVFGSSTSVKPDLTAKLTGEIKNVREEVNKINENYSGMSGVISKINQRIDIVETTVNNVSLQMSNVSTVQNNESLKGIMWTLAGIWIAWECLKVVKALVLARLNPGSTIKNAIGLKSKD